MISINWFIFFRQHIILGFYVRRKRHPDEEFKGPWKVYWKWNWNKTQSIRFSPMPWHRCWRWSPGGETVSET